MSVFIKQIYVRFLWHSIIFCETFPKNIEKCAFLVGSSVLFNERWCWQLQLYFNFLMWLNERQSQFSPTCLAVFMNLCGIFLEHMDKKWESTDKIRIFSVFFSFQFFRGRFWLQISVPSQHKPSLTFEIIFYFEGIP